MTDHSLIDRAVEALTDPLPVEHLLVLLDLRPGSAPARRALERLHTDRRIIALGDGRLASASRLVDGLVLWHRVDPVEASIRQVALGLDLSVALPVVPGREVVHVGDDVVVIGPWLGPGDPDVERGPTVHLPDDWEPDLTAGDLVAVTVEEGRLRLHRDGDPALPAGPAAGAPEATELGRVLERMAVSLGSRFRYVVDPDRDPGGQWLLEMVATGRDLLADAGDVVRALHRMPFREAVVRAGLTCRGPVIVGPDTSPKQVETYLVGRIVARGVCPDHPEVFEACGILSEVLGGTVPVSPGPHDSAGSDGSGDADGSRRLGTADGSLDSGCADRSGGADGSARASGATVDDLVDAGDRPGDGAARGAGDGSPPPPIDGVAVGTVAELLDDPFIAETMGVHLRSVHRWQAAEAEHRMRAVVDADPGAPGPAFVHATLLLRQGRAHDAVRLLEDAVAGLDADDGRAWKRVVECLARLRMIRGDLRGAMSLLRRAGDHREVGRLRQWLPRPPDVGRNERCPCGSGAKAKACCLDDPAPLPIPARVGLLWDKILVWSLAEGCGWSVARAAMDLAGETDCDECAEGLLTTHDVHLMEGDGVGQVIDEVGVLLPADEKDLALRWRSGRHRLWRVESDGADDADGADDPPIWHDEITGERAAVVGLVDCDGPAPRLPVGLRVVAALLPGPAGHHLVGGIAEVVDQDLDDARLVLDGSPDAAAVLGLFVRMSAGWPPGSAHPDAA